MADLDLLDLLSGDHGNLLDEAEPRVQEISQHLSVERDLLYPLIHHHLPGGEAVVERLRHSERRLEELLEAAEASTTDDDARIRLARAVRHHVSQQERLFVRLRRELPPAVLVRPVQTVPLAIGGAPTHGHPGLAEGGPVGEIVEDVTSVADHVRDRVHGGRVPAPGTAPGD